MVAPSPTETLSPWMQTTISVVVFAAFQIWSRIKGNKKIDRSDEKTEAIVTAESLKMKSEIKAMAERLEALENVTLRAGDLQINLAGKFTETVGVLRKEISEAKILRARVAPFEASEQEQLDLGKVEVIDQPEPGIGKVIVKP